MILWNKRALWTPIGSNKRISIRIRSHGSLIDQLAFLGNFKGILGIFEGNWQCILLSRGFMPSNAAIARFCIT